MLESNAHSPVATRAEFAQNVLIAPENLLADLELPHPSAPGCLVGFYREMGRIAAHLNPLHLLYEKLLVATLALA